MEGREREGKPGRGPFHPHTRACALGVLGLDEPAHAGQALSLCLLLHTLRSMMRSLWDGPVDDIFHSLLLHTLLHEAVHHLGDFHHRHVDFSRHDVYQDSEALPCHRCVPHCVLGCAVP